jgi:hypothetical protein
MAISQLPAAPSKSDPATFNARAEALVAALNNLVTEINAQANTNTFNLGFATAAQGAKADAASSIFAPITKIGCLNNQLVVTSNLTLTSSHIGALIIWSAGSISLPAINSVISGSIFILKNTAAVPLNLIANGNSHDISSLTIYPFETICIQSDGGSFFREVYRSRKTNLGVNQSWTDVKSSRAFSVNYTNTTGAPIQVSITVYQPTSSSFDFIVDDGNGSGARSIAGCCGIGGSYSLYSVILQNGCSYQLRTLTGSPSIYSWFELR